MRTASDDSRVSDAPSPTARWARAAAVSGGLGVLVLLLVVLGWQPLAGLDRGIAEALHAQALARPDWTHTNRVLTDWVWDPWTMRLLIAVTVVALWVRGERWLAAWAAVATALCGAVQTGLKALVGRERPEWEVPVDSAHYAAMPSGHVMTLSATAVLLLWLLRRTTSASGLLCGAATVLAVVSVAGVSVTRMVLGVHWMTDTLVGALLGAAFGAAAVGVRYAWGPGR
ncbi:phosphatase PAP2 family protein [Streptomyces sp. HNM0574]|uniref:phosphatase PAP2 family protein n=1 Tax=Streptomyces sp. HNM0574 TaxID=2714954 RepID=UPI00146E62CD|nr:phosphatase PAP2 family protein [Streptomyces sp. HNM0574]NLU68149.1 phosphatase PAP2 family protein [Streptomyces sp. HNM0574]